MPREVKLPMRWQEIQEILPHRYPFIFVDEMIEFSDAKYAVGRKYVSANEPYFQGHFPGLPMMPGVLMLEALAQLGALFAKLSTGGVPQDKLIVFSGADEVRFRRPVVPGDILTLTMKDPRHRSGHWKMIGDVKVDGQLAVEALITATEVSQK